MDITLDATARDWQGRAFRFATEELIPCGGRGGAARGAPAARGREAAQEARHRTRIQRDGRAEVAGRTPASHRRPGRRLGAARPRHQRALLVLLRGPELDVRGLHRGPGAPLHPAAHARRAEGMLRDHRERLGQRRLRRDDGAAHEGRLCDHRGEVVRHEREPRRLLHPAGAARGRPACGRRRAVLHRPGHARASRSCVRRSSATRSAPTTRPTASRTSWCRKRTGSGPRATACASRTPGSAASG